jgi:hypothetical protein
VAGEAHGATSSLAPRGAVEAQHYDFGGHDLRWPDRMRNLSLSIGATTVFLQRARSAEMSRPLPEDMADEALEARLFPTSTALAEIKARRPQPDWRTIHRELRRNGTAAALGGAPCRAMATGTAASGSSTAPGRRACCRQRQAQVAGDRLFFDCAGTTLEGINGLTGEVMTAQLFVAALGARPREASSASAWDFGNARRTDHPLIAPYSRIAASSIIRPIYAGSPKPGIPKT